MASFDNTMILTHGKRFQANPLRHPTGTTVSFNVLVTNGLRNGISVAKITVCRCIVWFRIKTYAAGMLIFLSYNFQNLLITLAHFFQI